MIEQAKKIILAIDKTSKAQKLYLPNNQILLKHKSDLLERFRQFLEKHDELTLLISPEAMFIEEEIVYQNENRKESFAFRMYNDGIRSFSFLNGLSEDELLSFTMLLGKEPDDEALEGDLVTSLWESEFPHIRYTVADSIIEEQLEPGEKTTEEKVDEILALDLEEHHPDQQAGPAQQSESEVLDLVKASASFGQLLQKKTVLNEEELGRIKKDIEFSERPDKLLNDLIDIFLDIMRFEENEADFKKIAEIIGKMVGDLFNNGLVYLSADVCQALRGLLDSPLKIAHQFVEEAITEAINKLSRKENIENYVQVINQGYRHSADDLARFIGCLQPQVVKFFLDSLPLVVEMTQRRTICQALATLHQGDSTFFAPYLRQQDPQMLSDILHLLSYRQDNTTSKIMAPLIKHSDRSVRREVISSMRNFSDKKCLEILLSALNDEVADNRTLALRIIAGRKEKEVIARLIRFIKGDGFIEREMQEKKSALYALAKSAEDQAIPAISETLQRKKLFKKEALDEVYQCAIYALAAIGSEASLQALYRQGESNNKAVKKYALQAIRKITQQQRQTLQRDKEQ